MIVGKTFDNSMLFTSQQELVPILQTGVQKPEKERSLLIKSKRLNVAHPSQAIKASFNHSTNAFLKDNILSL